MAYNFFDLLCYIHLCIAVSPEVSISQPSSTTSSRQCLTPDAESLSCYDHCLAAKHEWNLTTFATRVYAPLLEKTHVKVCVYPIHNLFQFVFKC